jgi:hypothetical protein
MFPPRENLPVIPRRPTVTWPVRPRVELARGGSLFEASSSIRRGRIVRPGPHCTVLGINLTSWLAHGSTVARSARRSVHAAKRNLYTPSRCGKTSPRVVLSVSAQQRKIDTQKSTLTIHVGNAARLPDLTRSRHRQSFLPIQPVYPLMIDLYPFAPQHRR